MASHTPFLDPQRPHLWGGEGSSRSPWGRDPKPAEVCRDDSSEGCWAGAPSPHPRGSGHASSPPRPPPCPPSRPAPTSGFRLEHEWRSDAICQPLAAYGNQGLRVVTFRMRKCRTAWKGPSSPHASSPSAVPRLLGPLVGGHFGLASQGPLTLGPSHVVSCTILDAQEKEFPAPPPLPTHSGGGSVSEGPQSPRSALVTEDRGPF